MPEKSTRKIANKTAKKIVKKVARKAIAGKAAPKPAVKKTAAKKPAAKKPAGKISTKKRITKTSAKIPAAPPPAIDRSAAFRIGAESAGQRIDRFLGERLENASRTRIQKWMEEGAVRVNGDPARKSRVLEAGDTVDVERPAENTAVRAEPEDIPLEIVFEDRHLAVVNKPKGLVTPPGAAGILLRLWFTPQGRPRSLSVRHDQHSSVNSPPPCLRQSRFSIHPCLSCHHFA
jgi:ribosomal 50S subunit-recycling heat shock protein